MNFSNIYNFEEIATLCMIGVVNDKMQNNPSSAVFFIRSRFNCRTSRSGCVNGCVNTLCQLQQQVFKRRGPGRQCQSQSSQTPLANKPSLIVVYPHAVLHHVTFNPAYFGKFCYSSKNLVYPNVTYFHLSRQNNNWVAWLRLIDYYIYWVACLYVMFIFIGDDVT